MSTTTKSSDIIGTMAEWFAKFPQLPKNWQDTLARIAPILSLVFGILGIILGVMALGVLTIFSPFALLGGVTDYGNGFLAGLVLFVTSVLSLAAYPGLKARKYKGWKLLFWSRVVSLIGGVISLHGIIGTL